MTQQVFTFEELAKLAAKLQPFAEAAGSLDTPRRYA